MAKKPPREVRRTAVPIKWLEDTVPTLFANQLVVQTDDHDCYLSFYEIVPPLTDADQAEKKKQLEGMKFVPARCVARIVVSADRMAAFAGVLKSTATRHKAIRKAHGHSNGAEK